MGLKSWLQRLMGEQGEGEDEFDPTPVEHLIGYTFNDPSHLILSLTHRSYSHLSDAPRPSNERLEFLGDSVLGVVIADQLYRDNPSLREGELTKTRALLVNESTLAMVGTEIGLPGFLRLSPEEDRSGGRKRPSIISDAFESIIGAVYIDGGYPAAKDLVLRLIYSRKERIVSDESRRNYKGELLEIIQGRGDGMPRYDVVSETGPDHEKTFHVVVTISGEPAGEGAGLSKKEAEQKAAAAAMESLAQ
ncbi:MAG: ribonuclease III [Candidatus Zixiibacteriota bacterium]